MVTYRDRRYAAFMPTINEVLGANLKRIRVRIAGTQERFEELTGLPQTTLSELERGEGWRQIAKLAERLRQAGIDPTELLNISTADLDDETAEGRARQLGGGRGPRVRLRGPRRGGGVAVRRLRARGRWRLRARR